MFTFIPLLVFGGSTLKSFSDLPSECVSAMAGVCGAKEVEISRWSTQCLDGAETGGWWWSFLSGPLQLQR